MSTTGTTYTLEQYKTDKQLELEAKKKRKQERARVNHELLMKYLPKQLDGASDGVLASAKIAAANALANQLAGAESEYTSGMNDVLNNYRIEKQAEEERARQEQDAIYGEAKAMIEDQKWNTTGELSNYLYGEDGKGGVTAGLSDVQKQNIAQLYKTYANDTVKEAEAATAAEAQLSVNIGKDTDVGGWLTNTDEGNDFKINGYYVELGTEAGEGDVPASEVIKNIGDRVPFAYNGMVYIKIDGKVYKVRNKSSNSHSGGNVSEIYKYLTNSAPSPVPNTSQNAQASNSNWITGTTKDQNGEIVKTRKHR